MSEPTPPPVLAEPVEPRDPKRLAHLAEHRSLIIKRSLLATAMGGIIPVPVVDDYVASRVKAGLYIKLASHRHVDLPQAAADLLSDPKDASTIRNATLLAATMVAIKLAWHKFFALLAAGRGAEEMANSFQYATLVDHYLARLHVGGAVTRPRAAQLRVILYDSIDKTGKGALVSVFRDGGRVLSKSVLEAPRWISERITIYAQRWAASGGRDVPFDPSTDLPPEDAQKTDKWLDRAARVVEERLAGLGNDYLGTLLDGFEERWKKRAPEPAEPPSATPVDSPVDSPPLPRRDD